MRDHDPSGLPAPVSAARRADLELIEALLTERVRLAVSVCDIAARDATLATRLCRLLDVCNLPAAERSATVQGILGRAWSRVARDRGSSA